MPWLPHEKLSLDLPQPPAEASAQLAAIAEPVRYFRFGKKTTIFQGDVNQREFNLQRILVFERNSFMPQIHGTFEAAPTGTRVKITFNLNPPIMAVMLVSFAFLLLVGIATVIGVCTQGTSAWTLLISPLSFMFFYGMMNGLFWQEVTKAKDLLTDVWQIAPQPQMTSPAAVTAQQD